MSDYKKTNTVTGTGAQTAPLARIIPVRRVSVGGTVERNELRNNERVGMTVPLRIKTPSIAAIVAGKTVNLSRTGMFVVVGPNQPMLAVGSKVDLELELDDRRLLLHAHGVVVRHSVDADCPGFAIRFDDVSYEAQELIEQLIDPVNSPT